MYGYNPARTSYKPITTQLDAPVEVKWKAETKGDFLASPVIANEILYIGGRNGHFQARDPRTGREHWHLVLNGEINIPPAFNDGAVFVGTTNGHLYALDATGGIDILGKRFRAYQWSTELDGSILSPPAVADGTVYAATVNGTLTAHDTSTGKVRWKYQGGRKQFSAPAVGPKRIYFNRPDINGYVVALSRENGEEQWSFKHDIKTEATLSSPAITDNHVIFGSPDGHLYALDAETGTKKWQVDTKAPIASSPSITDTRVFIGNTAGRLYALDSETGAVQWTTSIQGSRGIRAGVTVTNTTLFVATRTGNVLAFRTENGTKLWSVDVDGGIYGEPVITKSKVFVQTRQGTLYAIGSNTENQ